LGKTVAIKVKPSSTTTNLKLDPDIRGKIPAVNCLNNGTALHKYVSTAEGE
jgi:hypothetical protein